MTYNVFGGTLNLTQSINQCIRPIKTGPPKSMTVTFVKTDFSKKFTVEKLVWYSNIIRIIFPTTLWACCCTTSRSYNVWICIPVKGKCQLMVLSSSSLNRFLANVNSSSRSLTWTCRSRPSVCLSVCRLSVTFVRPTQAIEIFRNVSTPFGTLGIRDLSVKILRRSSQGHPSVWGVKHKRGSRI